MEFLGTKQLASYCGTKKSCLFPDLAPTSTTKDAYQSYYLPGYRYLSSWGPSLLYKVASVPPSSDKQFSPIGQRPLLCLHYALPCTSEDSRECAGRLNADSMRLMQDKDQLIYQMQKDSRRNLGERICTTDFWRSELIYELESLLKETQDLETTKKRLDCAADEMKEPLKAGFTNTTALTVVQSKVFPFHSINRDAQHVREQDLCDKNSAHLIDEKCFKLRNTSDSINFYHGVKKHKGSLQRGLVAVIPICFSAFSVQLLSALTVTSLMYSGNCLELTNMFCFVQILQEIFQTEDTVMLPERSIKAKEYPLKVAQTRLEERTKRPNIELCRDQPIPFSFFGLVTEVYTIDDTLQILKRRLQEAHDTLQMLNLYKSKLEHEISVKANSFFIDKKCMDMCKVFPSTPQLIGYT
uniref:Tektin n=1 Tax=Strix occidentalis caurina TaxID=311401 RepID=A0A8D0FQE0_STROC